MKILRTTKRHKGLNTHQPALSPVPELENISLRTLGENIVRLIEKMAALSAIMLNTFPSDPLSSIPQINILNRADRSAGFLAGYTSRFPDCPFYAEDAPTKCLVNSGWSDSQEHGWDCLGLGFFRGIPCERLWAIFLLEKEQKCLSLFDLPK